MKVSPGEQSHGEIPKIMYYDIIFLFHVGRTTSTAGVLSTFSLYYLTVSMWGLVSPAHCIYYSYVLWI